MIEFLEDKNAQVALARFGRLSVQAGREYSMPSTAPTPRTEYEARALAALAQKGLGVSAIAMPLARLARIKGHLDALVGVRRYVTIDDFVQQSHPLVLPDLESEALSLACRARKLFQEAGPVPEALQELLQCGLTKDRNKGRMETGEAWDYVQVEYGLSSVRQWFEAIEARAGSPIFLAPTPIIRASIPSVSRAFSLGWNMVDTVEDPVFRGRGLHLLPHSEIFLQDESASAARMEVLKYLRQMGSMPSPRVAPFISLKVFDGNGYLQNGTGAKVARQNLRDFLVDAKEYVRAARGLLILHDFGTWALGALDSGVDIVTFRCDGRKLEIDPLWGEPSAEAPRRIAGQPLRRRRTLPPFDPIELCDGHIRDFKESWKKTEAFRTADHVQPQPYWTWPLGRQREYRASQVIGSLVAVGKEYREAAYRDVPLTESLRSRVARMKEQDALLDLCPSL